MKSGEHRKAGDKTDELTTSTGTHGPNTQGLIIKYSTSETVEEKTKTGSVKNMTHGDKTHRIKQEIGCGS